MRKSKLLLFMFLVVCWSCKNETGADEIDVTRNVIEACNVKNPLTDLPWLKEIVDRVEKEAKAGDWPHDRIYLCNYKDGIGFLLELCVGCPDFGFLLKSCEGKSLCVLWGLAGDPCPEFNIDFENKKLLWEVKRNFVK